MKQYFEIKHLAAVHPVFGAPDPSQGGCFYMKEDQLFVIASWVEGWDHLSVTKKRGKVCPTWEEMEKVKRTFFNPDEVCMQLHVAEKDHINCHPFCLHIWRPHFIPIPLPPKEFVG